MLKTGQSSLVHWLEKKREILGEQEKVPAYTYLHGEDFLALGKDISLANDEQYRRLTHTDLLAKAKALAARIQQQCSQGERVLLLYPHSLDYIIAFFACIYAGVIAVPSYPPGNRRRWGRFDSVFKNAEPALILTTQSSSKNIVSWQQEKLTDTSIPIWETDNIECGDSTLWQWPDSESESIAFLQYSSGSTGTPKGVMVSHANILNNLQVITDGFQLSKEDVGVSWLPIYHDMGLIGSVLEPFYLGMNMYMMSPLDILQKPGRWLKAISQLGITASGGPNFIYDHCIKRISEEEKQQLDLSSWRLAFNGAEPINTTTLKKFSKVFAPYGFNAKALTPCYGMAETTLMVSSKVASEVYKTCPSPDTSSFDSATELTSSGRVHHDYDVKIVHPDTQLEMVSGQVGEIWVSGPSVAKGYWGQQELSEKVFKASVIGNDRTYLRTGDLGFITNDELVVTGRLKELIIIRGQNYYPQDIEASVSECHLAFSRGDGAAFSVEVEGSERLVVVHEVNRGRITQEESDKVVAEVRGALAESHQLQLHALILIKPASLLRTTSGKIQRVAMKKAYLEGQLKTVYHWSAIDEGKQNPVNQHPINQNIVDAGLRQQNSKDDAKLHNILNWLREYAEKRINSKLIDERRCIPPHIVLDMGNKGLMGVQIPQSDGGLGFNHKQAMKLYQQLGAIDASLALFVGLGNVLGLRPIQGFANERMQQLWLKNIASGRNLAAFAITEPGAGSNPLAMTTTAVRDSEGNFCLNGCKIWSGTAAWASVIHVFAKTYDEQGNSLGITAFMVEQGLEGLQLGAEALTMGLRGTSQCKVIFNNVRLNADAVLGNIGQGMVVAQDAMKFGRLVITSASIGGMKRCAQLMARYARRRQISTGRLLDNPVTIERLNDIQHAIIAVESLVNHIASCLDRGIEVPIELYAACKISGPEYFWQTVDHLVQLLGGRGYVENNIAPQLLRDARILRIFEGPSETLSMFVGARVHKQADVFVNFIKEYSDNANVCDVLRHDLELLATKVNDSHAFEKQLDGERWLHERSGRLAVLATLKSVLSSDNNLTLEWLDRQYHQILQSAQAYLSQSAKMSGNDVLVNILAYENDIGDIEQTLAGEDHELDHYLKRGDGNDSNSDIASPSSEWVLNHNKQMDGQTPSLLQQDIERWMCQWIAKRANLASDEIDVTQDFIAYGLDSVDAVSLSHDLENAFDCQVNADLAWTYPNILSASHFLAKKLRTTSTPSSDSTVDTNKLDANKKVKWEEGEI